MGRLFVFFFTIVSFSSFASLVVSDATVRLLPAGVPNTAAYFTIENTGETDQILVNASGDLAETLELHNHVMHGDVMRMEKQEAITVPAGQTVSFAPGGLHVMLFSLTSPLKENQTVTFQLITETGETIPVNAKVVMPGKESNHHHGHH